MTTTTITANIEDCILQVLRAERQELSFLPGPGFSEMPQSYAEDFRFHLKDGQIWLSGDDEEGKLAFSYLVSESVPEGLDFRARNSVQFALDATKSWLESTFPPRPQGARRR